MSAGEERSSGSELRDTPNHVYSHQCTLLAFSIHFLTFATEDGACPETLAETVVALSTSRNARFDGNRPEESSKAHPKGRRGPTRGRTRPRSDYPSWTGFPNLGALVPFTAMTLISPQSKMSRVPTPEGAQNIYHLVCPISRRLLLCLLPESLVFSSSARLL